jgi:hypothetical protein
LLPDLKSFITMLHKLHRTVKSELLTFACT